MLDFHQQVGSVVAHISEQCKELLGEEHVLSRTLSREQMKAELMQALIASGRYFTFKEQMEVRGAISITGTLKLFCDLFLVFSLHWQQICKMCRSVFTACSFEDHP